MNDKHIKDKVEKEFVENQHERWEFKAKEYIQDREKAEELLDKAIKKAENRKKGPLGEIWEKVQLLFNIFKDWIDGTYKDIPVGSILMIAAGLVYFVVPFDIIPDWVAGLGIVDDATILGLIIKQVNSDLDKYKLWKDNNGQQFIE